MAKNTSGCAAGSSVPVAALPMCSKVETVCMAGRQQQFYGLERRAECCGGWLLLHWSVDKVWGWFCS